MSRPMTVKPARAGRALKLLCAALALGWALPGHAADASAAVQITGLQLVTSTGAPVAWLAGSSFQSLYAESREAGGLGGNQLLEPPPGAWVNLPLGTSTAHASASATGAADGRVAVQTGATFSAFGPAAQANTGAAWALLAGDFMLASAGTVSLVLDYQLSATAPLGDAAETWAHSALMLSLTNLNTGAEQIESFTLFSPDLAGGSGVLNGRVTLTVALGGPLEVGSFGLRANADASASAVSAVPEPAHWALMLGGLGVLVALQRRRGAAC